MKQLDLLLGSTAARRPQEPLPPDPQPDPTAGRSFVIELLELFNWGPFNGLHRIRIDPHGTAVIGQTGSGKTTLVDALMTLIAERPLYNLASTGGHESDRDLVSYIRGVSGAGDQTGGDPGDNGHIARPGATVTALAAWFGDGREQVTLGALLWLDGSSSAVKDLKRIWLFSRAGGDPREAPGGVGDWLPLLREGGARALKQYLRDRGAKPFDAKSGYLTQLKRFFEVGDNAFALLNRAAGLKQLNSVDQLFRELVLEDRSAFKRAEDAATVFDTLTAIHQELETARRQQQTLLPIDKEQRGHRRRAEQVEHLSQLQTLLPVWFAGHALHLWQQRHQAVAADLDTEHTRGQDLSRQGHQLEADSEALHRAYIEAGGGSIEQLEQLIATQQQVVDACRQAVRDYQRLVKGADLDNELSRAALHRNQQRAAELRDELRPRVEQQEQHCDEQGALAYNARQSADALRRDLDQARAHADSNLPGDFLRFKHRLAEALGVAADAVAFVAELVEVKPEQQAWRGAIERALGGQRLRLIVPGAQMHAALDWVNRRDNRLHVRLLDAGIYADRGGARFFDDGFTRKLNFARHPLREALKHFLGEHDLHCVDGAAQLHRTPHGLTIEGMTSGKQGRFDKQDQRRLDQGWLTGFDNRDRLRQLEAELDQAGELERGASAAFEHAKQTLRSLLTQVELLQQLEGLAFDQLDLPTAEADLERHQTRLRTLQDPDSDSFRAKQAWEQAKQRVRQHREQLQAHERRVGSLLKEREQAEKQIADARRRYRSGLNPDQSKLADERFAPHVNDRVEQLEQIERNAAETLNGELKLAHKSLTDSENRLVRLMGAAKKEDTGALAEAGTELRDIPQYLRQLDVLTKEALPEKLQRFLDYLNKSSDESITQVLAHIDNEVSVIEERIAELNQTLVQVDFQPGRYLQLEPRKVVHAAVNEVHRAQKVLRSAKLKDDQGESHYRALFELARLLRDAAERRKTGGARALLDPRYRLQFFVKVIERDGQRVVETRTGSQGGSGGEKEIIASYILTASLSYALCPDGVGEPLFGTVVLDEAFSKSSQAVAARIIEALRQFGLHPLFITPNKEMRLLREHTRSAVLVHKRGNHAVTTSLRWEDLDREAAKRLRQR